MSLIERKTGTAYRRLGPRLTSDEIVARASDVQAVTCPVCKDEGFLNTDHFCPSCSGSGAVLVPRRVIKTPRAAHGWGLLGWALLYLAVAGLLAYGILR